MADCQLVRYFYFQDCTFVYPWFSLKNADRETVLKIKGPLCPCKCCKDVEFQVIEYQINTGPLLVAYYTMQYCIEDVRNEMKWYIYFDTYKVMLFQCYNYY